MPQMAPLAWVMLLFMSLALVILLLTEVYFMVVSKESQSLLQKEKSISWSWF